MISCNAGNLINQDGADLRHRLRNQVCPENPTVQCDFLTLREFGSSAIGGRGITPLGMKDSFTLISRINQYVAGYGFPPVILSALFLHFCVKSEGQ